MDTATINQRGIAPIKAELDRIRAMENMPDVVAELVRLHRVGIGVLFNFGARRGRQGFQPHDRGPGPGRSLAAGSRILSQDRRQERGDPAALRGAHDEDVPAGGRIRRELRAGGAHGARDGDDSRQGLHGSRFDARPEQDLSHHDQAGSGATGAELRLGPVFSSHGSAGLPDAQREPARLHQADRGGPGEFVDRIVARVLRLPPAAAERRRPCRRRSRTRLSISGAAISPAPKSSVRDRPAAWPRWTANSATFWDRSTSS